jgi:hypothetical protein
MAFPQETGAPQFPGGCKNVLDILKQICTLLPVIERFGVLCAHHEFAVQARLVVISL